MERRDFIKNSCTTCLLIGTGTLLSTLSSCVAGTAVYKAPILNDRITVPVSLFDQSSLQIVRPRDYEYDIAIRKDAEGKYSALLMRCTHADNPIISTGTGYTCNLHGSNFDNAGKVTRGPAERPLTHVPIETINENITIKLNPNP